MRDVNISWQAYVSYGCASIHQMQPYIRYIMLGGKPASCNSIRLVLVQSFAQVPMHLCNAYMNGAALVSYTQKKRAVSSVVYTAVLICLYSLTPEQSKRHCSHQSLHANGMPTAAAAALQLLFATNTPVPSIAT